MAKLTVYFKNNVVQSYSFETERVHIGRDDTNDLVIDSPALAPAHAVIVIQGNSYIIKHLNDDFPLMLNGKITKESKLHDGDTIIAGQYVVIFSTDQSINDSEQRAKKTTASPANLKTRGDYIAHTANFQVVSGVNIGKIFHLNTPMTLLGERGSGMVVISKRKGGYFASVLENIGTITLNQQPLDDKIIQLNHQDILVVGNSTVQFYLH
jgi:pSer/pThr/pTyr-binding forkhead associated (FHA) protein